MKRFAIAAAAALGAGLCLFTAAIAENLRTTDMDIEIKREKQFHQRLVEPQGSRLPSSTSSNKWAPNATEFTPSQD